MDVTLYCYNTKYANKDSSESIMIRLSPDDMVMECHSLDTLFWSSILDKGKSLQKMFPRKADKVVGGDLFTSLYHWNPQVKSDPDDKASAAYISRLMKSAEYEELRAKTKGDKYRSAAGAVRLFRELMRPQESDLKSVLESKHWQDRTELMFSTQEAQDIAMEPLREVNRELADYIEKSGSDSLGGLERNKYGQFSVTAECQNQYKALNAINDDMGNAEELSAFNQPSGGMSLDPNNRGERFMSTLLDENIVNRVGQQDKLRDILKVAGRMKLILEGAKTKKPTKVPVHAGTKLGGDINELLASELMLLADEDTEDLFYYKLHEHTLRQRDKKKRDKQGQGPFICCVDISGSMSGWRVIAAMGLFVSLARLAVRDKRKVAFIPFASNHSFFKIESAGDLISAIGDHRGLGYGTMFDGPLKNAHSFIKEQRDWKKADIMMVSDGRCSVEDQWVGQIKREKEELGYRMFALSVNSNQWPDNMKPLWDAKACVGESGNVSDLEWLNNVAERLV